MKLFTGLTAAVLVAVMAQGCGGDDPVENTNEPTAGTGGAGDSGGTGGTGGDETGGTGGSSGSSGSSGSGGSGGGTECGGTPCADYNDPTLGAVLAGGLPACCAGENEDMCGLDVTAAEALFTGLTGCMELNQPEAAGTWNCESISMSTSVGDIELPPCCRAGENVCGVSVSVKGLGDSLGFPLTEGAEFGCVDPIPFLGGADPSTLPDFWKLGDAALTEAPACVAQ